MATEAPEKVSRQPTADEELAAVTARDMSYAPALITVDPQMMSGVPCFGGRRVPVHYLFDYLAEGSSIDEFLHAYPWIHRDHVLAILAAASRHADASAVFYDYGSK